MIVRTLVRDEECVLKAQGWQSGLPKGKQRCPLCDRVIFVKNDGTCAAHRVPVHKRIHA